MEKSNHNEACDPLSNVIAVFFFCKWGADCRICKEINSPYLGSQAWTDFISWRCQESASHFSSVFQPEFIHVFVSFSCLLFFYAASCVHRPQWIERHPCCFGITWVFGSNVSCDIMGYRLIQCKSMVFIVLKSTQLYLVWMFDTLENGPVW